MVRFAWFGGLIMCFDKLLKAFFHSLSGIKFLLQERAFLLKVALGTILYIAVFFSKYCVGGSVHFFFVLPRLDN